MKTHTIYTAIELEKPCTLPYERVVTALREGEIVEDAKPDQLFSGPRDPRTKALIDRYRTGAS